MRQSKAVEKIFLIIVCGIFLFSLFLGCDFGGDLPNSGVNQGGNSGGGNQTDGEDSSKDEEELTDEEIAAKYPQADATKYELTFADYFERKGLNEDFWSYQIGTGENGLVDWGNNEKQYYNRDSVEVKDGKLNITAKRQSYQGKNYTSGRITTRNKFSQTYGRFEARIKLPIGQGLWPAFWLLPEPNEYGTWARNGEIDIMEAKGRLPDRIGGAIHFGGVWPNNKFLSGEHFFEDSDITDFHVYAVEWQNGKIGWFVDDIKFYETSDWYSDGGAYPAPFDRSFHIILNLAVGGNFDDNLMPDNESLPAAMTVDYVRVYKILK